jgi:hypothetical protein
MDVSTGRRGFLVGAGMAGAGAVLGNGTAAAGAPGLRARQPRDGYVWLAGDHHIHSQYSNDAMYPVATQVERAARYGLDWLVITDHGNVPFATYSVPPLVADIVAARRKYRDDVLVFTGLEWNIPAGEHTTLMLAPGRNEAALLQEFVTRYDARVNGTRDGTPANEAIALQALAFLKDAVTNGRIADAIVLPNHPSNNKTWVGATGYGYRQVMQAMRAGRMWVCFGDLVAGLDLRLRPRGSSQPGVPMGGTLKMRAGRTAEVVVRIDLADHTNFAGLLPVLARVDLILGRITGPAADRSTFRAPDTKVVKSWNIDKRAGTVELVHEIAVDGPFYIRVRGTDGKRGAPGYFGAGVDPAGPALDVIGEANPWEDLWFYSNPVFATT